MDLLSDYVNEKNPIPYYQNIWAKRSAVGDELLARYILPLTTGPRETFLDIGAGIGAMMACAEKAGFTRLLGIEPNLVATNHANTEHKNFQVKSIDICKTDFATDYPENNVDVALSYHTFEHLYDPLQSLRNIHGTLRKDGLLCVVIPQIQFLLRKQYQYRKMDNRGLLDASAHIYYYSLKTLSAFFAKSGFEVLRAQTFNDYVHAYRPFDDLYTKAPGFMKPAMELLSPSVLIVGKALK
jgi:SAM-dependent methyltransferase